MFHVSILYCVTIKFFARQRWPRRVVSNPDAGGRTREDEKVTSCSVDRSEIELPANVAKGRSSLGLMLMLEMP